MEYFAASCNSFSPRSRYFPRYPIFLTVSCPWVCEVKLHTNSCVLAHIQNMRQGSQHFPRPDQIFLVFYNQYLSSYAKWSVPQEAARISRLIPHLCFHSLKQNCETHYTSAFCDTDDACGICLCNAIKSIQPTKNTINIMKLVQKSLNNMTHILQNPLLLVQDNKWRKEIGVTEGHNCVLILENYKNVHFAHGHVLLENSH